MYSNLKLHFLNGPMAGEEVMLPLGRFTLGKGGDLWLFFPSGAESVALEVSEEGVTLVDAAVHCWVEGNPWTKEGEAPQWFPEVTPIELEGLGFLVVPGEVNVASLPEEKRRVPVRVEALPKEGEKQALKPSLSSDAAWVFPKWPFYLLGILVVAGGFTATVLKERARAQKALETQARFQETESWLEQKLQEEAYAHLSVLLQPNGEMLLTGKCRDSEELQLLLSEIRRRGWVVRSQVTCDDELVRNVQYTLRLFGFDTAVVRVGENLGTVAIFGSIQGGSRWQQVEELLSKMPGLVGWSISNQSAEQLEAVTQHLREANLANQLDLVQRGDKLVLTGKLNAEQTKRLSQVLKKVGAQYPEIGFIYQNIETTSQEVEIWPAPVMTIGGSKEAPFIELSNGLRLQVGSRLPSGYQIIGIDEETGVRLMIQGKVVNIPLEV